MNPDTPRLWCVFWTHQTKRHLIDFDNEGQAVRAAVALAEIGRESIFVDGPHDCVIDEIAAERIKARVFAQLKQAPACDATPSATAPGAGEAGGSHAG